MSAYQNPSSHATMSADQPPPLPVLPPFHTKLAATLKCRHSARPDLYLALTFPALLIWKDNTVPIVLALEERFADFRCDVERILAVPLDCGFLNLRLFIRKGVDVYLCEENMCAALRHLREAKRDGSIIAEELGWPVYPGFQSERLEELMLQDRMGRSVFDKKRKFEHSN